MVQRSFIIGSKWMYYKIYTGPKASDVILTDILVPLVQKFEIENWITKWFFIRYADPKHHLRVRFLVNDHGSLSRVIEALFEKLKPYVENDIVWKVQLDTYHRELERYGAHTMELSESLFHQDSWATIQFLDLIEGDEGEQLRWLYGLRATDNLLNAFSYTLEEKLKIMEDLKIGFGQEFNMSRPLKKQLDEKYRKECTNIEHFMVFTAEEEPDYEPILVILEKANTHIQPVAKAILAIEKNNEVQMGKNNLMGSYIHMLMNRLFKSKNRLNEMVCYDFLFRHYRTALARNKKLVKSES